MEEFAGDAQKYVPENPELKQLTGMVYYELGYIQEKKKNYSAAEKYYSKALEFGENALVYFERGSNWFRLDEYDAAFDDLRKAALLSPEWADIYYWNSVIHSDREDYEMAAIELYKAYLLDPFDNKILQNREWLAVKLTNLGYQLNQDRQVSESLNALNHAILLKSDHAMAYYRRASILARHNQFSLAEEDLIRTIDLDPGYYHAYLMLDWVLSRQSKFAEIVPHWDRYIETKPDHSAAYVDRGSVYYRMKDYKNAIRDAKLAADMGDSRGKEAYEKVKHLDI